MRELRRSMAHGLPGGGRTTRNGGERTTAVDLSRREIDLGHRMMIIGAFEGSVIVIQKGPLPPREVLQADSCNRLNSDPRVSLSLVRRIRSYIANLAY